MAVLKFSIQLWTSLLESEHRGMTQEKAEGLDQRLPDYIHQPDLGTCRMLCTVAGRLLLGLVTSLPKPHNLVHIDPLLVQLHNLIAVNGYCILEIKRTLNIFIH